MFHKYMNVNQEYLIDTFRGVSILCVICHSERSLCLLNKLCSNDYEITKVIKS